MKCVLFFLEVVSMPQIFDKVGREKVREQLFEAGFQLIKLYGLKKTSVADISKKAGIATGTFYNFFPSKEEFIYQLMLNRQAIVKKYFDELIVGGKADKEHFRQYLRNVYFSDYNIFDYLNESELNMLIARFPEEYWQDNGNDKKTTQWFLENLEGVSPNCDWKVFANLSKSISFIRNSKQQLYQDKYDETLDIYIDAIVRYVFE